MQLVARSSRFAVLISRYSTGLLAKACRVSPGAVSQWKTARMLPRPSHYDGIAFVCGLSVDEISQTVAHDHIERAQARQESKKINAYKPTI